MSYNDIITLILLSIVMGVVFGFWWVTHSLNLPFLYDSKQWKAVRKEWRRNVKL